ncbi:hypothetical protein MJO29_016792 [Puccinia striiformis f. sp. tritici]|nr:hypothetical protein MJO29_016792 [Puccinia striiformis f. sp. tritici]
MARARPTRIKPQVNPADLIDDYSSEYEGSDEISDGESFEEESKAVSCDDDMECSNVEPSHRFDQPNEEPGPIEDPSSSEDDDYKPVRRNNPKEWYQPDIKSGTHTNFIDHGTTVDENGYPYHPNGQTTFVHLPTDEVGNFGKVGFSKHSAVSYAGANKTWKITRFFCLGFLTCDNAACTWAGAPPTCRKKWKRLPKTVRKMTCPGLAGHCLGKVSHQRCEEAAIRIDQHCKGWGLLRHKGQHNHPWPEAKKPDLISQGKFTGVVQKNPKAGAFKLKPAKPPPTVMHHLSVFQASTQHTKTRIALLIPKPRVAYYRRQLLGAMGLTPDKLGGGIGDKFILDMFGWSAKGLLVISSSFMPGHEHFTFQSSWMAEQLLARDKDNKLYSGGFLSDVTYRYFENGYLLTTSMYDQFFKVTMTHTERDALACQVIDFSAAQTNGFAYAYMKVFQEPDKQAAIDKLCGCKEHYRQSISRVKINRPVILGHEEEPFRRACMDLLTPPKPDGLTHEQQVNAIYRRFPKVRKWLDWWCMAVSSLLLTMRQSSDK